MPKQVVNTLHNHMSVHIKHTIDSQWYAEPYAIYAAAQQRQGNKPLESPTWIATILTEVAKADVDYQEQLSAPTPVYPQGEYGDPMHTQSPDGEDDEIPETPITGAGIGKGLPDVRERAGGNNRGMQEGRRERTRSPVRESNE